MEKENKKKGGKGEERGRTTASTPKKVKKGKGYKGDGLFENENNYILHVRESRKYNRYLHSGMGTTPGIDRRNVE